MKCQVMRENRKIKAHYVSPFVKLGTYLHILPKTNKQKHNTAQHNATQHKTTQHVQHHPPVQWLAIRQPGVVCVHFCGISVLIVQYIDVQLQLAVDVVPVFHDLLLRCAEAQDDQDGQLYVKGVCKLCWEKSKKPLG